MKKIKAVAIVLKTVVLLFYLVLSASGEGVKEIESLTGSSVFPPDIQRIIERGKFIVGIYYQDKPPFIMTDEKGNLYGIDISLAKKIAKYLGVQVEFNRQAQSYEELHALVARGEVDAVISKFSITFERAKNVRFSNPYVTFRQAIMLNKIYAAQHKIESYPLDHLRTARVKIGARAKTSYVEFAGEMFPKAIIVEDVWENLVQGVVRGDLVAIIRDEYEILKVLQKNPDVALYVSVYVLKDKKDYLAIAVPSESVNLLAWLNIFLDSDGMHKDVNDIIKEYPEMFEEDNKEGVNSFKD